MKYATSILNGVFRADDFALSEIGEFLEIAEGSADDVILGSARFSMGIALVHSDSARRERGLEFLAQVQDMSLHKRFFMSELPIVDVYAARERARRGDPDAAISVMRAAVAELANKGQFGWLPPAMAVLAETLLDRGTEKDIAEAEIEVDKLAAVPPAEYAARDILVLRLRALLSRARGDDAAYRAFLHNYREMAESLGLEGHIAWAEAMPATL